MVLEVESKSSGMLSKRSTTDSIKSPRFALLILKKIYVYGCFAYICRGAPNVYLVPKEVLVREDIRSPRSRVIDTVVSHHVDYGN